MSTPARVPVFSCEKDLVPMNRVSIGAVNGSSECVILTCMVGRKETAFQPLIFPGIPKIIFASRTHSQLSQAVQELKNTAYRK